MNIVSGCYIYFTLTPELCFIRCKVTSKENAKQNSVKTRGKNTDSKFLKCHNVKDK